MAFSSNPLVRELQSGIGFAFRPIQGALDDVAGGVASIARRRSPRSTGCASTTRPCAPRTSRSTDEQAAAEEIAARERAPDRAAPAPAGFDNRRRSPPRSSPASRRSSGGSIVIDKGSNDGIEEGDVVVAGGGALAGRVIEVGPDSATVVLITDATSTVIGQLCVERRRRARSSASSAACSSWTRSTRARTSTMGDEVVTAGIELGRRRPVALPEGPAHRPGHRRPARRERRRPDGLPAARGEPRQARIRAGVITTTRAACRRSRSSRSTARPDEGTLPEGEQPNFRPTPAPTAISQPRPRARRRRRRRPLLPHRACTSSVEEPRAPFSTQSDPTE